MIENMYYYLTWQNLATTCRFDLTPLRTRGVGRELLYLHQLTHLSKAFVCSGIWSYHLNMPHPFISLMGMSHTQVGRDLTGELLPQEEVPPFQFFIPIFRKLLPLAAFLSVIIVEKPLSHHRVELPRGDLRDRFI